MAHSVPTVCDGLAARIRALRSKDQGCKNVGGGWRGNVPQRSWGAQRDQSHCGGRSAYWRRQTCGASLRVKRPVMRGTARIQFY
jgi:hypothetical protein